MRNDKPLHKLLEKQLSRSELDVDKIKVSQPAQWEDFLFWLSNAYYGYEQERYLLERSMEISAREYGEINEKLQDAQELAHMGYFYTDVTTNKISWSPEMFKLAGIDPADGTPDLAELLEAMHEEDRPILQKKIEKAFLEGAPYEMELRWKNKKTGQYNWCHVKASPALESGSTPENIKVKSLSGVVVDISDRKKNEAIEKKNNEQMLFLSRRAGMAEIATSVLHNIGNVLNSANVSIGLMKEISERPVYERLVKIGGLLNAHKDNLKDYIYNDEKGKVIPGYLTELLNSLEGSHQELKNETIALMESIVHIKDIVLSQNAISGASGVMEKISLEELVMCAVQMTNHEKETQRIEFKNDFQKIPSVYSDKSKVLQICVNLIQNAKDAVLQKTEEGQRCVELMLSVEKEKIFFKVKDNGVGITPEDAKNIFSFGFTTKKNGHGFGLHSSILSAQELGGNLRFESSGVNQGSIFVLSLPLTLKTD